MFGLIAHSTADASLVSNFLLGAFRMSCFSEPISEVQGIEVFAGKKADSYKGKSQDTTTKIVIVNERDIVDLSAPFGDRAIVNNQITVFP